MAMIEPRQEQKGVDLIGVSTGFTDLDYVFGGWRKNEMYGVAAKTGGGKTAFCMQAAVGAAQKGAHVFYVSLEMSAHMMALRAISGITGVSTMKIERGQMTDETFKLVKDTAEKFANLPLYIYDRSVNSTTLHGLMAKVQNDHGLDMSIVDYIGLVKLDGLTGYDKMTQLADDVRSMATDFDIPLIAVAQLNRASLNREDGRPKLQDFKESGQVENNCGGVVFPYLLPDDPEREGAEAGVYPGELIVAKNRHGPNDYLIPVDFIPSKMKWVERIVEGVDPPSNRR